MAIPPTAVSFTATLDPHEELDFVINCGGLLEVGEEITSYTLTPLAEAVALGLTIMSGSGRDHALITGDATYDDNTAVRLWLEIDDTDEGDASFDAAGVSLPVEIEFVTNSSPARTRQRTVLVKVAQQ